MMAETQKYKKTGIEWMPEIPEHWQMWKVSRAFNTIGSGTTPESGMASYYDYGTINWVNTGDLNDDILENCEKKITQNAFNKHSTLKIYPKGTLLVAMYGATIGKVALMNLEGCSNQACCALANSDVLLNKYTFYWFISNKKNIIRLSYGGGQPNISQEVIKQLRISTPPIEEQKDIINYLDAQSDKINNFIQKKQRLIELLKEQRQSIISEAVTKGINPNAKLKPSGIDWLGEIPEHWEVRRLKNVGKVVLGKMLCNEDKDGYSYKPYLKSKNIGWEKVLYNEVEEMWFSPHEMETYRIHECDLLVSEGGEVGKTCIWRNELEECYIQNSVHKITYFDDCSSDFYLFYMGMLGAIGHFKSIVNQVSIAHLTREKIVTVICLHPPIDEQQQIVAYIKSETATIDTAISKAEREIELIKEYKEAMIAEAVMGKGIKS